ncbi:MAG TPA: glutamine--tRNA ligase/YqeY domain fusion protein [Candidatus Omnitrophota bacterium]|nr:glutamine--tRNA ligase/YqeY domain fusion protein [Candidatus Omnitrophota bacterium]HPT07143.1 glutamine--tRNA ligase/YqeY domain fusion protein [Candidatus Omnitrophota bacterium]
MEIHKTPTNFIREIIDADLATGKNAGQVHTRFPPEPNGYLHIGHAKSICLNFGIARDYKGLCNLRFDDTNPETEEVEYVNSIQEDVRWLGFDWQERMFYASDYFEKLYAFALELIKKGKAYVCDQSLEEMRQYRGTITEPGKDSPYRTRSIEENLDLFSRMRAGEFLEGTKVLRGKIDMAHPNLLMRDPVFYRIRKVPHHRTKAAWCIYPLYDYTHGICDSLEGITHSICTLEFEVHRPLYDWILNELGIHHPQQIEFARLNLGNTVLSKRKLLELVAKKLVSGWDDPRMPTLSGLRRRGYTPESIRKFCEQIGVSKVDSIVDCVLLENSLREELNKTVSRFMTVLRPIKVVIDNYPVGQVEEFACVNNPEDPSMGTRSVAFSREIYIEEEDFRENPPKEFFRLSPGREVRLRYAYLVICTSLVKDAAGKVVEIHCTYDPLTRGGNAPDGRKVKSTIHWISCGHAQDAEVRLYDILFTVRNPNDVPEGKDFTMHLNPRSLEVLSSCKIEPGLIAAKPGSRYQFERLGYFCVDKDSTPAKPVFNRTVTLRDTWAKIERKL